VVPRSTCLVFLFCAPRHVFGGSEGVGTHFHILCSRSRFPRYRGRRVPFSCFALPDSCLAVSRALVPIFLFYVSGLIFGGTEGVGSYFHILRSRTHFQRYRGRQVPFSCFARLDSFSAVSRASGPFFMFYGPELVFDGTEGVGARFNILHSRTRFRRCRVRGSRFHILHPDSFLAVPRASDPFFMFCVPRLIFGGADGVESRFHVLRHDTFSVVPRASDPVFMFCTPELIFGGTESVSSRFHVLRSQTRFQQFGGCSVQISCFPRSGTFSAIPRASHPVSCYVRSDSFSKVTMVSRPIFIFCASELFSAVPTASGRIFVFCAPERILGGSEIDVSSFLVMRTRTRLRGFRVRRVPCSCFMLLESFPAVPRASVPIFMFCALRLILGGTEVVGSRFLVLRVRTHFQRFRGCQIPF
jgi:hypothetical protein